MWMDSEVETGRTWELREGPELLWCFQVAFLPQEPRPYPCFALQIHTCNKGPALGAWLLAGTQLFGMWDPALLACLLRGNFLTAPGHRACLGRYRLLCFPWRVLSVRGMQRLDDAARISTEAEHMVLGLGSDFLQDKCSWQGSMGRAFLIALVSRGLPRPG